MSCLSHFLDIVRDILLVLIPCQFFFVTHFLNCAILCPVPLCHWRDERTLRDVVGLFGANPCHILPFLYLVDVVPWWIVEASCKSVCGAPWTSFPIRSFFYNILFKLYWNAITVVIICIVVKAGGYFFQCPYHFWFCTVNGVWPSRSD